MSARAWLGFTIAFFGALNSAHAAIQCDKYDLTDGAKKGPGITDTIDTRGSIQVNGQTVTYSAHSGYMPISIDVADPASGTKTLTACVFYVAYVKDLTAAETRYKRPVTFAFNGGPGSSSDWVHVGGLGPRRLDTGSNGLKFDRPMGLIDNPWTLLDISDLVFVDPVNTGYSKPTGTSVPGDFNFVKRDAISVAEFIRLYLKYNDRYISPLFVLGESYGGNRASELANYLQSSTSYDLSGVIMISPAINAAVDRNIPGNDIAYAAFIPSFATTSQFHGKLAPELSLDHVKPAALFQEVVEFTRGPYLQALINGGTDDPMNHEAIVQKLAYYTGLSPDFIKRKRLRISVPDYTEEMFLRHNEVLGYLDSRVMSSVDEAIATDPNENYSDPYSTVTGPVFHPLIQYYFDHELEISTAMPYLDLNVPSSWGNDDPDPRGDTSFGSYIDTTKNMIQAMRGNQELGLFVAAGYYDLAIPMAGLDYELNNFGGPQVQARIERQRYESGHPVYITETAAAQFKDSLVTFYAKYARPAYLPPQATPEKKRASIP